MSSANRLEIEGPNPGLAIVTGGSRGIGAAISLRLGVCGCHVLVNYASDRASAERVASLILAAGGQASVCQADVGTEAGVLRLFSEADGLGLPLVGLVNNAAISGGFSRVEALTCATIERVFAVNVTGAMLCSREAVRRMSTNHGGAGGNIVSVSSIAAKLGGAGEWIHYAATKGAIDTFTVGLAREVATEGIRVNAVAPGLIESDFHAAAGDPGRPCRMSPSIPMQRSGSPEEAANAVVWLMSRDASYVSGAVVPVGGGR